MSRKPSRVVFVGCLGSKTTEDQLYEYFSTKIGGVEEINFKRDSNGNFRRFALVTFENPDYAQRAIDELDDTRFLNSIIHIEEYKTKRQQNYEREELRRLEEGGEEKVSEKDKEGEESEYSSSSSTSSSSSSSESPPPKRRKKHHHRSRHSSDKKSDSKSSRHHHRHHHHHKHH